MFNEYCGSSTSKLPEEVLKSSSDPKLSSSNDQQDYAMAVVRKKKKTRHIDCHNCNPLMDLENQKKAGPFKQVQKKLKKKKIYLIESCNSSTFNISNEIF